MQVNNVNSQNFQAINTSKATNALFKRLNTPERYDSFLRLESSQTKNPLNILLTEGKGKKLTGQIIDKEGKVLFESNECFFQGALNLSPIKFLKNLCKQADKLNLNK